MPDTFFGDPNQAMATAGSIQDKAKDRQANAAAPDPDQDSGIQILKDKMDHDQNMITITPQIALGLVKQTGDREWMKAIGTKIPAPVYTATYTHGIYSRLSGKSIKFKDGDQEKTATMSFDPDTYEPRLSVIGTSTMGQDTEKAQADRASREKIAAEKAAHAGTSKSSASSPDKDLDKWFKNANTARKEIQDTFNKKGGMPKAGKLHDVVSFFQGGDPANDAKIASLKQNYSDYQTAVQNYNSVAEKEGKAPINIDPAVSGAMDKIMALPGSKGKPDDQAVTDYLKKSNARDTPANRKWAEEQMSAK